MRTAEDYQRTEKLTTGDPCEFRYPARSDWLPGVVISNGGAGYWHVRNVSGDKRDGKIERGLYIEHVRAPVTRTATLELYLQIVDDGEPRQRWNGSPMDSAKAHLVLTGAVDAAAQHVRDAGMQVARTSYGVTAKDHG